MHATRPLAATFILVASLGTLAACGPGGVGAPAASSPTADSSAKVAPPTQAGAPVANGQATSRATGAAAPGSPAPAGAQAQPVGAAPAVQGSALPPIPPINRMVIKNGSLNIMVDDPEASLSQVDQLVKAEQGVIASQTVRSQNGKTFVNVTIQVPPDNFEETLARLRDLRARGTHVVNDTVNSQDVTEQYTDLDAQYRNLAATRDAYQKLLDKAVAVSDIVTLTREVASIQTQMDQVKGRQNLLSRQSAISTITLSLAPVGASPSGPQPLPRPLQAAQDAWAALQAGLQGLAVVLIWMGILLPIPALALGLAWLIYRRVTRPAHPTIL